MKKINLLISLMGMLALAGCTFFDEPNAPRSGEKDTSHDESKEEDIPVDPVDPETEEEEEEDPKKIGEFYGGVVEDEFHTGYDFSKSLETIEKPTVGVGEINIYSFNDFHGAVVESSTEVGLKRFGSFYKEKSQLPNTLIFDQGDTWQGSFESNYEHGAIVQDVFNYAGVSLRTVGNHDFDWGLQILKDVESRKLEDDYIPCLGANVFDYKDGKSGNIQQKDYGREYSTFTLDNGIKVGVVGVIGNNQITSICSQLVQNICFTNHVDKIKEISDYLRTTKECDIVIASTHESSKDMYDVSASLTETSPVSNKRYVDLVLGGHSHYYQNYDLNGVKFVQWASNGESSGLVNLKYNFETNELIDEETNVNTFNYNYMVEYYSNIDPVIESMIDDYLVDIEDIANEVLCTNFSGNFTAESIARIMTEAIYSRVSLTVDNLDFASSNYGREGFSGTTFKYRDLYKCFPFDNQIILLNVSSYYGLNRLKWDYTYREDVELEPNYGKTYKCAVIDYVALHTDEDRNFDRYPDAGKGYSVFNDTSGNPPTYRDIMYEYLKANPNKLFDSSNYQSDSPHFVN